MFCVITPVFDGAFEATKYLIEDLKSQTYKDFIHILISNGPSVKIKELADDKQFIYKEIEYEDTPDTPSLLANLGKRRNYCIKNIKADRYFFFDADLKVTSKYVFEEVAKYKADIVIAKIIWSARYVLPIAPIMKGTIDISNYFFSSRIAKKYDYPTDYNPKYGIANDWRFYEKIKNESHHFLNLIYAVKDGRPFYKNISKLDKKV